MLLLVFVVDNDCLKAFWFCFVFVTHINEEKKKNNDTDKNICNNVKKFQITSVCVGRRNLQFFYLFFFRFYRNICWMLSQ